MGSLTSSFIPAGRLGTAPFPLALHRVGSVLAVKGTLRRFAPWTAPGRSERRAAYEGKGGDRAVGREGELAHDKGYYHSYCGAADAPKGTFRPYQTPEPQPWGVVTRRAVAQRRSRAGGLTRRSAEAILGFRLDGLADWSHSVSRRETRIVRPLYRSGLSHGHESGLKMACRKDWAASAIRHPSF